MHWKAAAPDSSANATLSLTQPIFGKMMAGSAGVKDMLLSNELKFDGSTIDLVRFFTRIDRAPGAFAIVTKRYPP
jgi:alkyl sulfatase BDS1-like metallo-beta-lactamase superfamily hydrolase